MGNGLVHGESSLVVEYEHHSAPDSRWDCSVAFRSCTTKSSSLCSQMSAGSSRTVAAFIRTHRAQTAQSLTTSSVVTQQSTVASIVSAEVAHVDRFFRAFACLFSSLHICSICTATVLELRCRRCCVCTVDDGGSGLWNDHYNVFVSMPKSAYIVSSPLALLLSTSLQELADSYLVCSYVTSD